MESDMKSKLAAAAIAASVAAWSAHGLAAETTYTRDIKPLIDAKCAACHGAGAPTLAEFLKDQKKYATAMKGPRLDTYADLVMLVGWPDTGAIMRRLDDGKSALAGGKPGNMYQFLGGTEEERQKNLQTFKSWVGPEGWVLNRFRARGNVPGITKEQLERIQVKY
jgi:mono/diheme cytochrome c family protein